MTHPNSLRTALVAAMLAVTLLPATLVGLTGVRSISRSVRDEVQSRVDRDLDVVVASYENQLGQLAFSLEVASGRVLATSEPAEALAAIRRELGLTVLNMCDVNGRPLPVPPLAVEPSTAAPLIPVGRDPVLRRALEGRTAWGTVQLDAERLGLEGGEALQQAARVLDSDGRPLQLSALMWWIAVPLLDQRGRVQSLLYGGRMLNFNSDLVDGLRELVFSETLYAGKPRGTVTMFLGDVRVATNVLDHRGARAIGTRVSDTVRAAVLEEGGWYRGDALVVDSWYVAAYSPLRDPAGDTIGIVYVGLLRAPYDDMRRRQVMQFLLPVGIVALLAVWAALFIANRVTRPLRALGHSATRLAHGDWEHELALPPSYLELETLAGAYTDMLQAIRKRDQQLRSHNELLTDTNEKLEQSNRNYMQTLGFVTHELKAPLAAIQMMVATLMDGFLGTIPPRMGGLLTRIQRNCEELQDMVRDYLDLSRLEHGELTATMVPCELSTEVVAAAVDQTAVFFRSRAIGLTVECPPSIPATADPGLLRIALNNLLTNAAKYGREGGQAKLTVTVEAGDVLVTLWNDGVGFPPTDADRLFEKFFRVRNATTHATHGSGIGLFTVRRVAELHAGKAWAESESGAWAAFHLRFPVRGAQPAIAP